MEHRQLFGSGDRHNESVSWTEREPVLSINATLEFPSPGNYTFVVSHGDGLSGVSEVHSGRAAPHRGVTSTRRRPAGALRDGGRGGWRSAADACEADAELKSSRADIEAAEVRTLLSGEYDEREALVTIRSGGGVDAADWADMLMRMYIRWAEQHKYAVEVFDTSYAEEAGIKSATFAVHAPFAYGTLSVEQGTHRLVRISPFDNQSRRRRRSPKSRCCRWWRPPITSTFRRAMCASTSTAPAVPGANR